MAIVSQEVGQEVGRKRPKAVIRRFGVSGWPEVYGFARRCMADDAALFRPTRSRRSSVGRKRPKAVIRHFHARRDVAA
ncbi:hypothetical protein THITH_01150 [Thioalkalivibrio paradoxus ARh 1]|uniref:Uncharacterized protein n=1 Tax=Thioalkalivibrio paradoxus ARh 1 TaxID=713585 RepID=W0DML1_9GAMM|nr:hypothetical protein THITH_01150 [Thioalkalivibrio paradoxus ARh 1]